MSSEQARERAVHRYYQTWLESSIGFRATEASETPRQDRQHADGSSLRASNDTSLIAFAQLGCLQLNAKRGIVALISTTRQYIIAEATKTTSLVVDGDQYESGDEIWFGNASMPRSQGISEDALAPQLYTAIGKDGVSRTCPALVINDLTTNERYSQHSLAGKGVSFYCGVPILTPSGVPIGVYYVTDDKPRYGLSPRELKFMQDMARVVMEHLDTVMNDSLRSRGEQMVLGLGRFIMGESTTNIDLDNRDSTPHSPKHEPVLPSPAHIEDTTHSFKGLTITNADPKILKDRHQSNKSEHTRHPHDQEIISTFGNPTTKADQRLELGSTSAQQEPSNVLTSKGSVACEVSQPNEATSSDLVFSKAANILRECTAADGVIFYDAVSTNLAKDSGASNYDTGRGSNDQIIEGSASSDENFSDQCSEMSSRRSRSNSSSVPDNGELGHVLESRGKKSRMIGYSIDKSARSTASAKTIRTLGLKERSLRRFIRHYPQGNTFTFTADGEVSSDSDSSQRGRILASDGPARYVPPSKRAIAAELIRIVPGARTVIWLPLWDFSKQRWCAGTFLWSQRPEKMLTGQEDLTYLRTFGSCIMGEVARLEALSIDASQASFVANVSHELRSPLHGILGSIEFLQDTSLDAFQSAMITAVETRAKTLLDTVDHVLEYAKINHLSKSPTEAGEKVKHGQNQRINKGGRHGDSALANDFDLATIVEEVVEAVYAGQIFGSALPFDKTGSLLVADQQANGLSAKHIRAQIQRGSIKFSSRVRLTLDIEKRSSWMVHGQPGAIRRILMNILGNALKYTDEGTIKVSLLTSSRSEKRSFGDSFCIAVVDTGRGMSSDFLHNHAFTAFTQESKFSDGAGLGLNIVRQLVKSLGGIIEVVSEKDVGTEVIVRFTLSLATADGSSENTDVQGDLLRRVAQKTRGRSLCMLTPKSYDGANMTELERLQDSGVVVESTLTDLAEKWFGLRTMRARSMEGISADFFVYAEPPPIEYLLEHHEIHAKNTEVPFIVMTSNAFESASLAANGIHHLTDLGRVVEVIAQPCGPQKLAKALDRSMIKIAKLAKDPEKRAANGPADLEVHEDATNPEPYTDDGDLPPSEEQAMIRDHADHPQPKNQQGDFGDTRPNEDQHSNQNRSPPTTPRSQSSFKTASLSATTEYLEQGRDISPQNSRPVRLTFSQQSTAGASSTSRTHLETLTPVVNPFLDHPRVLLVDDNEINLNLLVAFMKKAKLPYECAKDGLQALQSYRRAASSGLGPVFQHVLMDISTPVMNGIAATGEIRQYEKRENIQRANIVALTGQASEEIRRELFRAGGDYFMTKPVRFKELLKLMRVARPDI